MTHSQQLLPVMAHVLELARSEDFSRSIVELIAELVPGCIVAFDEFHRVNGYVRLTHNMPTDEAHNQRVFARLGEVYQQNPVHPYYERGGKIPVIDIHDLTSRAAFKRTDLYQDILKPHGISDQVCITLERSDRVSTITINRDAAIPPQTTAFLKEIVPHLQSALAISRELGELRARLGQGGTAAEGMTRREKEVFAWMQRGKRNREIALILNCSSRTIEKHVENILRKTGAENRCAAIAFWHTCQEGFST